MKRLPIHGIRAVLTRLLTWAPLILCAMLLMPDKVHAQSCALGASGTQILNVTMPAMATIPRDAVLGKIIAQATITPPAYSQANPTGVFCTAPGNNWSVPVVLANKMSSLLDVSGNVMPTSIPGIGFKVIISGNAYATLTTTIAASQFSTICGAPTCYVTLTTSPITIQYVNTGPITGVNTIPAGDLYQATIGGSLATLIKITNSVQITGQTCSVTTPWVDVPLGSVKSSTFGAIGSMSAAVPFQIGLNCSGANVMVAMTFTDLSQTGNTGNVLSLTSDSTAAGVGIHITQQPSGAVINFGPDSAVAGNLHQIALSQINNTSQNFSFNGQYVKTNATITPGTAKGAATFTMSYQ